MQYTSMAYDVIDRFAEMIKEYGKMENKPTMDGRSMSVTFAPIKDKQ